MRIYKVILILVVFAGLISCTPVVQKDESSESWYQVYFTTPNNSVIRSYRGGIDQYLVESIEKARVQIDVAVLRLDLWSLRDALIRAHQRGVKVRLVLDSDNIDSPEIRDMAEAGIEVVGDASDSLMHNKFVVIDRLYVWTGSMNFTINGAYRHDNNLIMIRSSRVAQEYQKEFEEMFIQKRFGSRSPKATASGQTSINGSILEVLFSPDNRPGERMVELINNSQQSIYFLAYAFTQDDLAQALVDAHSVGVKVLGVMDQSQYRSNIGTDYDYFRLNGIDVRLDGNPDKMHHKVIIIDNKIVITGSYNFSRAAETRNDENVLIIHDQDLARQYLEEFNRIFEEAR